MCGRTACTLDPAQVCKACSYSRPAADGKKEEPQWKPLSGNQTYYPSYNVCPGANTPVLVAAKVVDAECETDYLITPMRWGLIPFWSKEEMNTSGFSMVNCRSETIFEKRSFKVPFERGRRCVVLADGFFEWKKVDNGKKQPYFIYFPKTEPNDDKSVPASRLLTMAGVFDVWKLPETQETVYSYSVITVESSSIISSIHDRMPAILDGDEAIRDWLDSGRVSASKAFKLLKPSLNLTLHPVSTDVSNSRNKGRECVMPIEIKAKPKATSASAGLMTNWLKRAKKEEPGHESVPTVKSVKKEKEEYE